MQARAEEDVSRLLWWRSFQFWRGFCAHKSFLRDTNKENKSQWNGKLGKLIWYYKIMLQIIIYLNTFILISKYRLSKLCCKTEIPLYLKYFKTMIKIIYFIRTSDFNV